MSADLTYVACGVAVVVTWIGGEFTGPRALGATPWVRARLPWLLVPAAYLIAMAATGVVGDAGSRKGMRWHHEARIAMAVGGVAVMALVYVAFRRWRERPKQKSLSGLLTLTILWTTFQYGGYLVGAMLVRAFRGEDFAWFLSPSGRGGSPFHDSALPPVGWVLGLVVSLAVTLRLHAARRTRQSSHDADVETAADVATFDALTVGAFALALGPLMALAAQPYGAPE